MTHEADNPMTRNDFHWMVSNHTVWRWKAPVKAKTAGFPVQVFENSALEVSEKSEIVATQAPELGQTER